MGCISYPQKSVNTIWFVNIPRINANGPKELRLAADFWVTVGAVTLVCWRAAVVLVDGGCACTNVETPPVGAPFGMTLFSASPAA